MDVIYRLSTATAADVHAAMQDAPTYTTVRGLLRILVEKGHLVQQQDGRRYVYLPATPRPAAGASHLKHVVRTFFAGSPADAMAALLGSEKGQLTDAELVRLEDLVAQARRTRRGKGE
jgi:BlaI family transcriptional regulator, penicillinase repressor